MTQADDSSEEPKLVVDTDWKEQVAKEKEAAAMGDDHETIDAPAADAAPATNSSADDLPTPPPASFEVLISMLFTQAMSMLGQMPDPASGETRINKPFAKHYIDTLEMLGEKTEGNLAEDESKILSEALHALRMMYVSAKES